MKTLLLAVIFAAAGAAQENPELPTVPEAPAPLKTEEPKAEPKKLPRPSLNPDAPPAPSKPKKEKEVKAEEGEAPDVSAPKVGPASLEAEWAFLKEATEDPVEGTRAACLDDLRLFAQQHPDSPLAAEALAASAALLEKQGDVKGALVENLRLIYEYPDSKPGQRAVAAYQKLSDRKLGRKQKEAVAGLAVAPEKGDQAQRLAQLVWGLAETGAEALYEPAVAEVRRFQARFPGHPAADKIQWSLAGLHAKNHKTSEALLAYRKLLAVYTASALRPQAFDAVGGLYAEQLRDPRQAIKAYEELVAQYPKSELVMSALEKSSALYADKLKEYASAVRLDNEIIKLFPKTDGALRAFQHEAKLQRDRMDLPEDAVATYRRLAIQFGAPDAVDALQNAADVARRSLKNYKLEAELRRKVAQDYPEAKTAADQLFAAAGIFESDLQDEEKAMEVYREVAVKFSGHRAAQKANERVAKFEKKKQAAP
ncbi:MAG: tetratricopeptide repeat protein [Elusimicrobiota bacterium]